MASRRLYKVTLRRTFTGCDYTKSLWLADAADALTAASRYVPRAERNGLRVVSCELENGWRLSYRARPAGDGLGSKHPR